MKTLRSREHRALQRVLREAREAAGLTQTQLASRLGKEQSYVAKNEGGERRVDVVEFVRIAKACGADPLALLRTIL